MRRVLLGLVGVMAAGAGHAEETYSFTTVVDKSWWLQTLIHCVNPAKPATGRVPQGCILSEPAVAWPNHRTSRPRTYSVNCRAGHPITFHPDGTLASCHLDGEQYFELRGPPGMGSCREYAYFDENGRADCD